jgi:hypothetical protein
LVTWNLLLLSACKHNYNVKTFIVILFATWCNWSVAQTYVQINGVSVHDQSGYNGFNYGGGIEQTVAQQFSVAAGWYRNSEYRGSAYAYGRYAVYKTNNWDAGIGLGVVTGYQRSSVLPMVLPELCYKWSCAVFVPKVQKDSANAIGFRLRIPVN